MCRTWLALGWNKASRRAWLLEKSVELNCAGLAFWQAERGQGQMPLAPKETWRAKLIAGAKQCGNAYLPELSLLPGGAAGIIAFAAGFEGRYLLLEAAPQAPLLEIEDLGQPGRNICVLGPEGGFADREIALLLAAGFLPRSLGRAILRWETAALQCLGLAFHAAQRSLV